MDKYIGTIVFSFTGDPALVGAIPEDEFSRVPPGRPAAACRVHLAQIRFLVPQGLETKGGTGMAIFQQEDGEHRYYFHIVDGQRQYYAHSHRVGWDILVEMLSPACMRNRRFYNYLYMEELLLERGGFILHSASVIVPERKGILFSAPSGTGKSTQAHLWRDHVSGTQVLNGDRTLLMKEDGKWFACGIPWRGTSFESISAEVSVGAVVVVRQAEKDAVQELTPAEKVCLLYSEVMVNKWKSDHVETMMGLLVSFASEVPMVRLDCTISSHAVSVLKTYLESLEVL